MNEEYQGKTRHGCGVKASAAMGLNDVALGLTAKRRPEVDREVCELETEIDLLGLAVDTLMNNLSSVCRSPSPSILTAGGNAVPTPSMSPLAEQIGKYRYRLTTIRIRINETISRLDI